MNKYKKVKYTRGIKTGQAEVIKQNISIHVSSHNKSNEMGWVGVGSDHSICEAFNFYLSMRITTY